MEHSPALDLIPFRGLRYAQDRVRSLAAVTSPPYDVVVRPDGQHHLELADPHNIVRLILPQSPADAAERLRAWRAEGVLVPDPEPALYVYEQRRGELIQRGVIGALGLSEPDEGLVLPHEGVMEDIVQDRAALMRATAANPEPLLLTYRGDGHATGTTAVIEDVAVRTPLLATTTEDGFAHRLWAVTDPAEIAAVRDDLRRHRTVIADGHHRWATYLRLRDERKPSPGAWAYGLVLLVDTARYPLEVRAIHRVLRHLPAAEAVARLEGFFRVRVVQGDLPRALDVLSGAEGNAFLLAGDGTFRLLDRPEPALLERTVRADRPEVWRTLDATVLHEALLDHVWEVPDDQDHIGYLHDPAAAVTQAERHGGTAVLMSPVREDVVRTLALRGVTTPRKATSFGPKPATGLVLRALDLG